MAKTPTPPLELADAPELNAMIYRSRKGDPLAQEELRLAKVRRGISDAEIDQRHKQILERKAAGKATAGFDPAAGRIVKQPEAATFTDSFLRWAGPDSPRDGSHFDDHLAEGPTPLPDLTTHRWHRDAETSEADFDYLLSLIADLGAGRIKRGKVSYLVLDRDENRKLPPSRHLGGLPQFTADALPMNFNETGWTFIRRRGQSAAALAKAIKAMEKNVEEARDSDGIQRLEQRRPAMAGGPTRW